VGSAHDHGSAPSFAEDLSIARRALAEGDHKHAAFHAACALAANARDPDALALADEILGAVDDALALFDMSGEPYFGVVALHSRARWRAGDRDGAVQQLGSVIGHFPGAGYATWLARWVPDAAPRAAWIALQRASANLAGADVQAQSEVIAAGVAAMAAHPGDDGVGAMHGRNLRICGQMEDALAVLNEVDTRHRTYTSGVTLATTRKIAGDIAGAIALFEDLCARFPDDHAVYLDLGDNRLELDRYDDAAAAYQHVVAREPHHDWAYPSLLYAKFLATGDDTWRAKLEDAALVDGASRARSLARAITPYLGYLPQPPEAVLKTGAALRDADQPPSGQVSLGLSSLEAPSAIRSLERFLAGYGRCRRRRTRCATRSRGSRTRGSTGPVGWTRRRPSARRSAPAPRRT
jgi:tetratricopeptide (TPR) repeat protein